MTIGADLANPAVVGKRTVAMRTANAYIPRLHRAAADDPALALAFTRVSGAGSIADACREEPPLTRGLVRPPGSSPVVDKGDLPGTLAAKDSYYDALFDGANNPVVQSTLRGIHARTSLLRGLTVATSPVASTSPASSSRRSGTTTWSTRRRRSSAA